MKRAVKLLSLFLALCMVVSMTAAFAADEEPVEAPEGPIAILSAPIAADSQIRLGTSSLSLYAPGYEAGELDGTEYLVGYYNNAELGVDFDVYQWARVEGETLKSAVLEENDTYETGKINGIDVVYYNAIDIDNDVEYPTVTYIMEDGNDFVEVVFYLDAENSEAEVEKVLSTIGSSRVTLGTSAISFIAPGYEAGELDETEYLVGYYNNAELGVDFDVYQWAKVEGETLETAVLEENDTFKTATVNGIDMVYYNAIDTDNGVEYPTVTYIMEDGADFVEVVFYLDAENSAVEVADVLATVASSRVTLGTSTISFNAPGFDAGELDETEYLVGYFNNLFLGVDFDVYQWAKVEGETLETAVLEENDTFETTTINGIDMVYYNAIDTEGGVEYPTVTYIMEDGDDFVEVVFYLDAENADAEVEKLLATIVRTSDISAAPIAPVDEPTGFVDVNNEWFAEAVNYCVDNKIMNGVGGNRFAPAATTTRAQLVTILYRIAQNEGKGFQGAWMFPLSFADAADVPDWAYEAIAWCSMNKIVNGYADGKFGPNDSITREQIVTILYRFAQFMGYDVSIDEDTNFLSFNDFFDVSEYAKAAMMWAIENGIIEGSNDNLNPQGNATRAQIATIFMRYAQMDFVPAEEPDDTVLDATSYDISGKDDTIDGVTFDGDVIITGENGKIVFTNCTFNGNVINNGGEGARVFLIDGCSFAENSELVIDSDLEDATFETDLPKIMIFCEAPSIVCEKVGAVVTFAEQSLIVNGTEYTIDNAEFYVNEVTGDSGAYSDQEANMHNFAMWIENGEAAQMHTAIYAE